MQSLQEGKDHTDMILMKKDISSPCYSYFLSVGPERKGTAGPFFSL